MSSLRRAIQMAGSQKDLAMILGIGKSNVSKWVRLGRVPACHAIQIEQIFGIKAATLVKIRSKTGS